MTIQKIPSDLSNDKRSQSKPDWRDIIEQWQQSGLSVSAFCRQQSLPEHQIHYYRRKFLVKSPEPQKKSGQTTTGFTRVAIASQSQGSVQLRLPSGIELNGLSLQHPQHIAELVRALS